MTRAYMPGTEWPDEEITVSKGQRTAGHAIGILLLDFWWPYLPGDPANATTFDFPVLHRLVRGSSIAQVKSADPAVGELLIERGRELEAQGVRAIVGACGFFGNYQRKVASALDVPVFLSSLLQIPAISRSLKADQKIGVFGDARFLTPSLFSECGVDDLSSIAIADISDVSEIVRQRDKGRINPHRLERELVELSKKHVSEYPEIGALLWEFTEFPSFAWAVQGAVNLPIFDVTTLIHWVNRAVIRRPFAGFI